MKKKFALGLVALVTIGFAGSSAFADSPWNHNHRPTYRQAQKMHRIQHQRVRRINHANRAYNRRMVSMDRRWDRRWDRHDNRRVSFWRR